MNFESFGALDLFSKLTERNIPMRAVQRFYSPGDISSKLPLCNHMLLEDAGTVCCLLKVVGQIVNVMMID